MAGWVAQETGTILQLLLVMNKKLDAVTHTVTNTAASLSRDMSVLAKSQQVLLRELDDLEADIKQILKDLAPRPAVGFTVEVSALVGPPLELTQQNETGENTMAKKVVGATADVSITDTGAVLITINAVDADQVATAWPSGAPAPTAAEVDPSGAPGPSFDPTQAVTTPTPTGYTIQIPVLQPPPQPLVTGIGFNVTAASGFANQTAPIVIETGLVDVVAGPAGSFVASVSDVG